MNRSPSSGNTRQTNADTIVTGPQAAFLVKTGMRDAANYTETRVLSATEFAIQSARPVPWFQRNPIAQGVKSTNSAPGPKDKFITRQGNNQL